MEATSVRPGYELWRPNRAKPETKTVKHTVTKRKTVHKPGSTSIQTVTGPSQTVTHTVTQTKTVPTTVTQTVTVTTGPPPPP